MANIFCLQSSGAELETTPKVWELSTSGPRHNRVLGEKKKYSRQALLIFQHMYVGPPLDADLKKITAMLAEGTYDWTPQNDKWLKDRRSRRRS